MTVDSGLLTALARVRESAPKKRGGRGLGVLAKPTPSTDVRMAFLASLPGGSGWTEMEAIEAILECAPLYDRQDAARVVSNWTAMGMDMEASLIALAETFDMDDE